MARHRTSATRRAGQVLAGLAALALLVGIVAGVPLLLVKLAGNPLPHTVPNLRAIGHALTARDNGQLFLHALTLVAWAAWAVFSLAVLVEVPAAIRRRPALRLPGLGLPQRVAANLIAAVALMLHAPAMASAATAHPLAAAPAPAPVVTTAAPSGGHVLTTLNLRS
ncbi:MAG TPA: peptidoglycan-binding protein, partial [Rugosimonospora sp.]|nr:peptidoglycan-binding protein [Rugosimonospora sp.]